MIQDACFANENENLMRQNHAITQTRSEVFGHLIFNGFCVLIDYQYHCIDFSIRVYIICSKLFGVLMVLIPQMTSKQFSVAT
jgi:hypothetical protein